MAIHISTDYYWISSPKEYDEKGSDLAFIAAMAKKLNLTELHSQAKKAYSELYNKWDSERKEISQKKSNTNWLGAGSIYLSQPMMPWEFYYGMWEAYAEELTLKECEQQLNKILSNK